MKRMKLGGAVLIAIVLALSAHAQVGVGTDTPDSSALLDVSGTTGGFLPPRVTYAQMNAIVSPAEGLIVYCTDCDPRGIYYYDRIAFLSVLTGSIPENATVLSGTGKTWMDRNLGATQVATSSIDAASYGDLYQWGRAADGHQVRTSETTATLANTVVPGFGNNEWDSKFIITSSSPFDWLSPQDDTLWQGISGTNNPCPAGYRLPTQLEWEAEQNNGGTGYWGTGSLQDNRTGAFESVLKLPVAGYRMNHNGAIFVGVGVYWSDSVDGRLSKCLFFDSDSSNASSPVDRVNGASVRCIKD